MTFSTSALARSAAKMLGGGGGVLVIYRKLLRFSGISLWLFLLIATHVFPGKRDGYVHAHNEPLWYACWVIFGPCFWFITSSKPQRPARLYVLCVLETLVALYLAWLQPDSSITFLLIFVAWQMALIFPAREAVLWIVGQSIVFFAADRFLCHPHVMDAVQYVIYYGFKTFTCIIVILARQEAEARTHQAVINAQLEATRGLLAENSRSLERLHISRELHDAVGHRLTALFLHLEVARNGFDQRQIQAHVEKAQRVSQELLSDVRDVLNTLRSSKGVDLRGSLTALAEDLPGLRVHLSVPECLELEDPAQAEVMIRCVQEIITNTLKHAGASELWIELKVEDGAVRLFAHDDGRQSKPTQKPGLGLTGMRERFLQYGGAIELHDEHFSGFSITASLPLAMSEGHP